MTVSPNPARRAWLSLLAWLLLCSLLFWKPLLALLRYASANDNASHVLAIPFIVAVLLYLDRKQLANPRFTPRAALFLAVPAFALAVWFLPRPFDHNSPAFPALILSFLLLSISGFVAIFGAAASRTVWFDLAFLAFAIPFPDQILNRFIYLLQAGSADLAGVIFDWSGVPVLREGFVFHLPRLSIEVAEECSGIRSSIALLILAVLVAHFSFSKFWKKALFVAAGLLMMIVKNAVRIATLTLLASYVDPEFLYGKLHREGGVVFFLLGLALLLPVYWFLRRGEPTRPASPDSPSLAKA